MASLNIEGLDGATRAVELSGYSISIGRADENDICLNDDSAVSRRHARLLREDTRWTVEDLGSSNGTQVERDGKSTPVTGQASLSDGDVLTVGKTRLTLKLGVEHNSKTMALRPRAAVPLPVLGVRAEPRPAAPAERGASAAASLDDMLGQPPRGRRRESAGDLPARGEPGQPQLPLPSPAARSQQDADAASQELFLLGLRYRDGRLFDVGANAPFLLDDRTSAYIVFAGKVDVFAVELKDGQLAGLRHHLIRVDSGQALFGVGSGDESAGIGLLAVGLEQTRVLKLGRERLQKAALGSERAVNAAALLDSWVASLSERMASELAPKDSVQLDSGAQVAAKDEAVRTRRGVVWVEALSGEPAYLGHADLTLRPGEGRLPLTRETWLRVSGEATLASVDSRELLTLDPDWTALDRFHSVVKLLINEEVQRGARNEAALQERKTAADRHAMASGLADLAAILDETPRRLLQARPEEDAPLLAACQFVFEAMGLQLRTLPQSALPSNVEEAIAAIARASRTRTRDVSLTAGWWTRDNGPMLAYLEVGETPVALLQPAPGRYVVVNPVDGSRTEVNARVAAGISHTATTFYRAFSDRAVATKALLRFALQGCRRELLTVLILGFASGALATLVPIITNILFDSVIPASDQTKLIQVTAALIVATLVAALFDLTWGIAIIRVQTKMDSSVQAAVWDRLLVLPVPFFRKYATGDLSNRALGVDVIRQLLSGVAVSSILGVLFAVCSLAILFYYSVPLALIGIGMVALVLLVTGYLSMLQIRQQRPLYEVQGRVSSLVLEFITGIAKLRVAGAENRAFAIWARQFAQQRRYAYRFRLVAGLQAMFDAATSPITLLILFAVVAGSIKPTLSSGSFLGYYVAFAQFLAAVAIMTGTFPLVLAALPVYERMLPILEAHPEVDLGKTDAGELSGEIEVSHLSFRYSPEGALVLNDLSLRVKAGEMVAIVGPSGSGKSSLFRILLGFEAPEAGSVLYDGKELSGLDIRSVRRQSGVVLQNGRLMSGSILANIVGASGRGQEDAWDAARMAGLEDDIKRLPMGMNTMISEGGSNFSGGQRQRLMIARAVVMKPRILLFDEATSALDSKTQEEVSKNLEHLQATRIVIAHRLSTIRNADRIYVVVAGTVVQSGTYHELLNQPGPFAGLVRRQLV